MFKNIELKLLSIAIALLLASFVYNRSSNSIISFLVPIEISQLPAGKMIVSPLSRQVQLTIQGPSFSISRLAVSPPSFKVEVPPDVKDRFKFLLNPSELDLPSSVEVSDIDPAEILFKFEDVVTKDLVVDTPRVGRMPASLSLGEMISEPAKVTVVGPASEVNKIKMLETDPLDLRDLKESGKIELNIRKPGNLSKLSVDKVVVSYEVINKEEVANNANKGKK